MDSRAGLLADVLVIVKRVGVADIAMVMILVYM